MTTSSGVFQLPLVLAIVVTFTQWPIQQVRVVCEQTGTYPCLLIKAKVRAGLQYFELIDHVEIGDQDIIQ